MTTKVPTEVEYLDRVEEVVRDVVAAHAEVVDRDGVYPSASMEALAGAGLLGLISAEEVGGMGHGPRAAACVVERLARECASTAMVTCMHYAGTAVIEQYGPDAVRREIAAGQHTSTLAFSESGSRSQFWVPMSTAQPDDDGIRLDARKSWVTSAGNATSYVWSSKPAAAEGLSSLWLVPSDAAGLTVTRPFDGMGLRGNDSSPVTADSVLIPASHRLGEDGAGFDVMMGVVLPIFNSMIAATSIGVMEGATVRTAAYAGETRYEHLQQSIADQPTMRAKIATMRIKTDMARALWSDTLEAIESGRDDAMLRVLECKAAAGATALEVVALSMQVCGGSAYRKDVAVERYFRDAQAATVMAPTTEQLHDFIGKAVCGLPLF